MLAFLPHSCSILPTPYILPPLLRPPWHSSAPLPAPNERSFPAFSPFFPQAQTLTADNGADIKLIVKGKQT